MVYQVHILLSLIILDLGKVRYQQHFNVKRAPDPNWLTILSTLSMDCVNNVDCVPGSFPQVVVQDVQNGRMVRLGGVQGDVQHVQVGLQRVQVVGLQHAQDDRQGSQVVEDSQMAVETGNPDNIRDNSLLAWDGGN